jgi:hypothetical protein
MLELDDVEHEGLSPVARKAQPELVDLRGVASSGLSMLVPLQFAAIGPISIGLLALATAGGEPWARTPMLVTESGGYSEPIAVPMDIARGALSPANARQLDASAGAWARSRELPALAIRSYEPSIMELNVDAAAPRLPLIDVAPEPIPRAPSAPTSLSVQ